MKTDKNKKTTREGEKDEYLGKGNSELRMPRETVDDVGPEYEGDVAGTPQGGCPVLCGEMSVELLRAEDAVEAPNGLLESLG
jgi:hypothetical protein